MMLCGAERTNMKSGTVVIAGALAILLVTMPASAQEDSWVDRIRFKGDVRIRHERIDEDFEEERARMRFRTRFGLSATVRDDVNVVLQFATGSDSPVSTNQSFDDGFSTKDIGVDLAYVDWKIGDGLNFYGGKMKNPLYKAGGVPLIWDGDLNPEGFALKYSAGNFFGTVGGFSAEERSSSDDSLLYVAQAGMKFPLGDAASLIAGVGYFGYSDTIGNAPFYDGSANGKTVDLNGDYIYD